MRLFLASQDFGDFGDKLIKLVGSNKKTLLIRNSIDDQKPRLVEHKIKLFEGYGLTVEELDLRKYFGQSEKLRQFIDRYKPGLIILSGGNTFILRRALAYSGFDQILKEDLKQDKYVLSGYSAGAIVCGPSLEHFERMDKEKVTPEGYKSEIIWSGLGLTEIRIVPHVDQPQYDQQTVYLRKEVFEKQNLPYVALRDSDVLIIDSDKEMVLRSKE